MNSDRFFEEEIERIPMSILGRTTEYGENTTEVVKVYTTHLGV